MRQVKAFGQSVMVVVWFYIISILGGSLAALWSQDAASFMEQHGYLVNILCYSIIFLGIFMTDSKRKDFLNGLKMQGIKQFLQWVMMGMGAYLIGICIIHLLIGIFPEYDAINQKFNAYEPIWRFISIVCVAPIVEEYLFRHKIQESLKIGFGMPIAILGQAILFGGIHYYTLQKIYAMILGCLFGYVKERKGIAATVGMHMTVNMLGWLAGCLLN